MYPRDLTKKELNILILEEISLLLFVVNKADCMHGGWLVIKITNGLRT